MALQWPLIIFTTLVAWSAGLIGAQAIANLKGEGLKAQMASLICSFALLVIGGIAVFFHLQHWERIFNGFGHITSGITQELIGIVILVVLMVFFFVQIRKNDGKVATWLAIATIAVALILIFVMAHSYMMASRPAWNSLLWVLAVYGGAFILGPCTFNAIAQFIDGAEELKISGNVALVGTIAGAVFILIYVFSLQGISADFASVGYYFDVTHPTNALIDLAAITDVLGNNAGLVWGGIVIVGAVIPVIAAILGKLKGNWKIWGTVAVVAGLIGAICLRVLFFQMGYLFFMFY